MGKAGRSTSRPCDHHPVRESDGLMAKRTLSCSQCGKSFMRTGRPGRPAMVCQDCRKRCSVDGCDRPGRTAGFCGTHYERWRRGRTLASPIGQYERGDRVCKVEGCGRKRGSSATYCDMHRMRVSASGKPGQSGLKIAPTGQAIWDSPDERRRVSHLWKFGLTPETFAELLAAQGGRCAICGTGDPKGNRVSTWVVDHDHRCCPGARSCGRCVRGLLCNRCNRVLGMFGDDPAVAEAAAAYLRRYTQARLSSA